MSRPENVSDHGRRDNEGSLLERAHKAATIIAEKNKITRKLELARKGPPTWTLGDGVYDSLDPLAMPTHIIQLVTGENLDDVFRQTKKMVDLSKALRGRHAQVQEFTAGPEVERGFVGTIAEYLPGSGKGVVLYDYAVAVASLHKAGAHPDVLALAPPFDPLVRPQETYEYLQKLYDGGGELRVGETVFPKRLVKVLGDYVEKGGKIAKKLETLSNDRGYPTTTVVHDIHPGNVRFVEDEETGEMIAIITDLRRISKGPPLYDLGRLRHWLRFGRREELVVEFLAGYARTTGRKLDRELLGLAFDLSDIRYAPSTLTHAKESYKIGEVSELDEWRIQEAIRRLDTLDDPSARWQSQEEYRQQFG